MDRVQGAATRVHDGHRLLGRITPPIDVLQLFQSSGLPPDGEFAGIEDVTFIIVQAQTTPVQASRAD